MEKIIKINKKKRTYVNSTNYEFEKSLEEPILMEGGLSVDDRGEVKFVNEFDMRSVRRFYSVTNHKVGFIRAWHAHMKEAKYVTVVDGAAIVAVVEIDNWEKPSRNLKIHRFVLSAAKPAVLFIPKGYANGFMTLSENTQLIFFSTATLEESWADDIRYDAYYWDPWKIVER